MVVSAFISSCKRTIDSLPWKPLWCLRLPAVLLWLLVAVSDLPAPAQTIGRGGVGTDLSLNGDWEIGVDRTYSAHTIVPGLPQDPAKPSPGTLWYRRQVPLPQGDWRQAVLTLAGARFAPEVYVNGVQVSSAAGGMAPTIHLLRSHDVKPGATITLEIALQSLNTLDSKDASMVPQADVWRTNDSSGLWDSVTLHFAGASRIVAMTPFGDWAGHKVAIHWDTSTPNGQSAEAATWRVRAFLLDDKHNIVARSEEQDASRDAGVLELPLGPAVANWSPEHPVVYKLRMEISESGRLADAQEISWGRRDFRTQNKGFLLNGHPVQLRGSTVMWSRFLRNPEAKTVAFDSDWFNRNVVLRLKSHGANLLRFNLALPPESFLDLCDREGLMVQFEWPFLHGIKASEASLIEQWRAWLDVAMRHPSVVVVHPWNETEGDDLKVGWKAINAVLADYPPLVVAHRDTVHLHKFWWSQENLGLYYDSADQFDRPVMADEFGGNYLDQDGNAGLYPATRPTFLRYLGRTQTRALRLELNAESNARVAEYWRRIGVAGFAAFCVLGSPFDGSSWFLGHLSNPQPMPVWDAMTAALSPQSVSLEVWDRNYLPGQRVEIPLFFFNDTDGAAQLQADVRIVSQDKTQQTISTTRINKQVPAHGQVRTTVSLVLPLKTGEWRFEAELRNAVPGVTHPIVSSWMFRTLSPSVPQQIAGAAVGVPEQETELRAFLKQNGLRPVPIGDVSAKLIVASSKSWNSMAHEQGLQHLLGDAVDRGASIVLLDIGPRDLGQGYRAGDFGALESGPEVAPSASSSQRDLFSGIKVAFKPVPEPESHVQPGPDDSSLWRGLPVQATWLWNGLRGGLIAPAADMQVSALGTEGLVSEWVRRGANADKMANGAYYAYKFADHYAFSIKPDDADAIQALRARVDLLVKDSPDLANLVDLSAKVEQIDLAAEYRKSTGRKAQCEISLSTCGKGLARTDITELVFGPAKGNVILSQVLTNGRLVRGSAEPGLYGIRYDPAAEQFVLNMLAKAATAVPDSSTAVSRLQDESGQKLRCP